MGSAVGKGVAILNRGNLKEGKNEPSGFVGEKHSRQRPLNLKSLKEAIVSESRGLHGDSGVTSGSGPLRPLTGSNFISWKGLEQKSCNI